MTALTEGAAIEAAQGAKSDRDLAVSNATHGNYDAEVLVRRLEEEGWTVTRVQR